MKIDAHHHLWRYERQTFGWIDPESRIARDFTPADLAEQLQSAGVDAAIAVQARQDPAETAFLLAAAEEAPILGVVGWVDLLDRDLPARLEEQADPRIVGYRHIVQDEGDDAFLHRDAFIAGVRDVVRRDLTYDLLVNHAQLDSVPAFLGRVGGGRFVLDHAAKPNIREKGWQPWADQLARIAECPWVWCKVSGLVTEADPLRWSAADLERYLDQIFTCFGPDRLLWGSDWPVCLLAAEYQDVLGVIEDYVARHCPDHHAKIFGGNAMTAYRLTPASPVGPPASPDKALAHLAVSPVPPA